MNKGIYQYSEHIHDRKAAFRQQAVAAGSVSRWRWQNSQLPLIKETTCSIHHTLLLSTYCNLITQLNRVKLRRWLSVRHNYRCFSSLICLLSAGGINNCNIDTSPYLRGFTLYETDTNSHSSYLSHAETVEVAAAHCPAAPSWSWGSFSFIETGCSSAP